MRPWTRLNVFGRVLAVVTIIAIVVVILTKAAVAYLVLGILLLLWIFILLGFGSEQGPRGGPSGPTTPGI